MKDTWIEWVEPFDPEGNPLFCKIASSTAISAQKRSAESAKPGFKYESDEAALEDFKIVHWATESD